MPSEINQEIKGEIIDLEEDFILWEEEHPLEEEAFL